MQSHNDDVLNPDFSNPLNYFNSNSPLLLSRSTIYADDDPWTTTSQNSDHLDFSASFDLAGQKGFLADSSRDGNVQQQQSEYGGLELTAANVLLGVDVPDIYYEIYSKSDPYHEKIKVQSLQIILNRLAGLTVYVQNEIIGLVIGSNNELNHVTRNEFNTFLALIACRQKNMDVSLETVFQYRNDLPIPNFVNLNSFNIRDLIKPQQHTSSLEQHHATDSSATEASSSVIAGIQQQSLIFSQKEQDAMNQWFRDLDHITISRTSEKEGFLFKHINYEVESEKLGSKALRRFSDFHWLWEVLLKRYPFRALPNLPPKKLGGRNDIFEEARRKGLARFINAVIRHPVLGKDEIVIAFLSHPSEINSWKRTNVFSLDEEFVRKPHNIGYLERVIPLDLDDRIVRMKKRLSVSTQQYEQMCYIMNQMNRLKKALGTDFVRYSITLNSVSEIDKDCWDAGCQGCPQIVRGYEYIAKSMQQAGAILRKQAIATGDSIVESLKRQRDLLESFRELLDRKERASPVQNETLSRLMAKYKKGKIQPSVAHDAHDAHEGHNNIPQEAYNEDSRGLTLVQQRDIFIKYCIIAELSYLHKQQASTSVMYNTYVRDEVKYARQWSEHWKSLEVLASEMSNAPSDFL